MMLLLWRGRGEGWVNVQMIGMFEDLCFTIHALKVEWSEAMMRNMWWEGAMAQGRHFWGDKENFKTSNVDKVVSKMVRI